MFISSVIPCLCCFLLSNSNLFYLIYSFTGSSEEPGEKRAGTCPTHRPQTSSPFVPSTLGEARSDTLQSARGCSLQKDGDFLKLIATQWKQKKISGRLSGEFIYGRRVVPREQLYVSKVSPFSIQVKHIDVVRQTKTNFGQCGREPYQ